MKDVVMQTTSFLNSTLYFHEPITSIDVFRPWMLLVVPTLPSTLPEPSYQSRSKHADSLFWCVFAIHHDMFEETKAVELQEKMAAVKWVTENKPIPASRLQKYTAELMSSPKTTWGGLYLLCLYYKVNVRVIPEGRNLYMDFVGSEEDHQRLVKIIRETTTFRVDGFVNDDDSNKISQDFRETKPMRGIGHYKVDDLKVLAAKLGVTDKKKKQEWYDAVYLALTW